MDDLLTYLLDAKVDAYYDTDKNMPLKAQEFMERCAYNNKAKGMLALIATPSIKYTSETLPYEEWNSKIEDDFSHRHGDTLIEVISNSSEIDHIVFSVRNGSGNVSEPVKCIKKNTERDDHDFKRMVVGDNMHVPLICLSYCNYDINVFDADGNDITNECSMKYGYLQTPERIKLARSSPTLFVGGTRLYFCNGLLAEHNSNLKGKGVILTKN